MKLCGYCGLENDGHATFCSGCGTSLPPDEPLIEKEDRQLELTFGESRLNGRSASLILLVYLVLQLAGAALISGISVIRMAQREARTLSNPADFAELSERATAPALFAGFIAGGLGLLLVSRFVIRAELRDTSPTGAAWVVGPPRRMLQGLGLGGMAGIWVFILGCLFVPRDEITYGPLVRMALTPGMPRIVWLSLALVLAPIFEELLFRGVLYGGYCRAIGPRPAAAVTTFIFALLHISEAIHFLPSILGIIGFALIALWLRLRSAAIGPAIAAHFGYNLIVALVVVYSGA